MKKYFIVFAQLYDSQNRFIGTCDSGIKATVYPNLGELKNSILADRKDVNIVSITSITEISESEFLINFS